MSGIQLGPKPLMFSREVDSKEQHMSKLYPLGDQRVDGEIIDLFVPGRGCPNPEMIAPLPQPATLGAQPVNQAVVDLFVPGRGCSNPESLAPLPQPALLTDSLDTIRRCIRLNEIEQAKKIAMMARKHYPMSRELDFLQKELDKS